MRKGKFTRINLQLNHNFFFFENKSQEAQHLKLLLLNSELRKIVAEKLLDWFL